MPRTGLIDHIGLGVPDLAAAKRYYDELMPILGLKQWFPIASPNYGPDGVGGSQLFFYEVKDAEPYARHRTGFHHIGFMVESRAVVREAYEWARARGDTILDAPKEYPEYGPHSYAACWLDPHGFKLEATCFMPEGERFVHKPG